MRHANGIRNISSIESYTSKSCTKCRQVKPLSDFRFRADRNIYESRCRECASVDRAKKYRPSATLSSAEREARNLVQRERDKKYREAHPNRKTECSKRSYLKNKEAVNARARAWAKRNREKESARMSRRRARLSTGENHTANDIVDLMRKQKSRCAVCKVNIEKTFTVDHVIPLIAGGGNGRLNIQLLCKPCNSRKAAKDPLKFMQQEGYLL